jgi:hypothetical protein
MVIHSTVSSTQINSQTNPTQQQNQTSSLQSRIWETSKEIASASLPFLALYKPFSYPIALGTGALRVGVSSFQLINAIREGNHQKIFSETVGTTVAVISLAGTFFAHPLGMLISTGYDLILEFQSLIQNLRESKHEQALQNCLKILGHSLYFAALLVGGPEITICFFAVQIIIGGLEARNDFAEGKYIAGIGHALMAIVRGGQLSGSVKTLQTKWELQNLIKTIAAMDPSDPAFSKYVGKLAEKWQFPSDHIPVGAQVGNAHVISWNILNNHFISWVTELDSQGLKGSLISKLNDQKSLKYEGLTLRDELVATLLLQVMNESPHRNHLILSLQECSPEFINAFKTMIPPHMNIVLQQNPPLAKDHNIVAYNKETFDYLPDLSSIDKPFFDSDPKRPLMNLAFAEKSTQEKFQIINVHIPGDPEKAGRNEFAKYVLTHLKPGYSTIALGDMNFSDVEMQKAFDDESAALKISNPFKNLAHYNTNISPLTFIAKPIDHIWVNTKLPCKSMEPNEVLPGLQSTVDLLHHDVKMYWEIQEAQKLEDLKKQYRQMQLKTSELFV